MAWMPTISRKTRISYSILYVLFGMLLYISLGNLLPLPNPMFKSDFTVRLTELVVIISLMGSGLKIDRPFSFRTWGVPFRLVSVTMVLSIGIVAALAVWLLKFDIASAVLLGAVLAPTDPVLASDVQVGPPMEKNENNVRFSLTAEAGMNDGTAFPFTWMAILLARYTADFSFGEWASYYLLFKIVAGALIGFVLGRLLAYMFFKLPNIFKEYRTSDGFVAFSATLVVYGITELLHGYGFIAVFVAAVTMRNFEIDHKYHLKLHEFTDQIERILVAVVLILFGGSLISGILEPATWLMLLFSVLFVLFIRPLTSWLSMLRVKMDRKEKMAVGFFGIKGMGSFYYLAFALNEAYFKFNQELWAIGSIVVLFSILLHGLTATPVLNRLEVEQVDKATVR